MGPVISEKAPERSILDYIDMGKKEGRLITGGEANGNFIPPTVIADVGSERADFSGRDLRTGAGRDEGEGFRARARARQRLAVRSYRRGLYEQSRKDRNRRGPGFFVGNLYINRKCTGAMVGAHPFGGFNMSGTDSKAGGPDYLLLFLQAKSIAEKSADQAFGFSSGVARGVEVLFDPRQVRVQQFKNALFVGRTDDQSRVVVLPHPPHDLRVVVRRRSGRC